MALKSMCSSAGAQRVAEICQQIEDQCKAETMADPKLIESLETAMGATVDEMRRMMGIANEEKLAG